MYVNLPAVTPTPADRLQALQDAKTLMAGTPETSTGGIFGGASTKPRDFFDADEAIRIAEYITTGHDYKDTHPVGKRRPKTVINVTVVSPHEPDQEDLDHLIGHILNGDFEPKPEPAEDEESATRGWTPEDPNADADPARDSDTPPPAWTKFDL